eukprot:g26897.t1
MLYAAFWFSEYEESQTDHGSVLTYLPVPRDKPDGFLSSRHADHLRVPVPVTAGPHNTVTEKADIAGDEKVRKAGARRPLFAMPR